MPLQSITLEVSDGTDTAFLSSALFELGAVSVSTADLHRNTLSENPIFAEAPLFSAAPTLSPTIPWSNAKITALFPLSTHPDVLLATICSTLGLRETPTLRLHTEPFEDRPAAEWVIASQAFLHPVSLGRAAIVFPWHEPIPGAINVVLGPGLAFGTGEHSTTQLCARWLIDVVRSRMLVLDFGTGSGVLAILAVMLKLDVRAVGVDNDPDSIAIALQNAKRNKVQDLVHFCVNKEEPTGRRYDLVVANILAAPLMELATRLVSRAGIGSRIALSGVLVEQASKVSECYQQLGVAMEEAAIDRGWALLVGVKKEERL